MAVKNNKNWARLWRNKIEQKQNQILRTIEDFYDLAIAKGHFGLSDSLKAGSLLFLYNILSIESIFIAFAVFAAFVATDLFGSILGAHYFQEFGFWIFATCVCVAFIFIVTTLFTLIHFAFGLPLFIAISLSAVISSLLSSWVIAAMSHFVFGETALCFGNLGWPIFFLFFFTQSLLYLQHNERICFKKYKARMHLNALDLMIHEKRRGQIILLEAQDHYVQVTTNKGQQLLRMKFGEAVKRMQAQSGLLVHRSFWVLSDAIEDISEKDGHSYLTLTNGKLVPISPSNLASVRSAIKDQAKIS